MLSDESGVIEKLLESWLDNATERQFQLPFCLMLNASGYRVLHMTRHCGMEFGKDVIALSPSNRVCVFQLKRVDKRLTQAKWQEMLPQVTQLVSYEVAHPSIPNGRTSDFDCKIVINGDLTEEVIREIGDFNRGLGNTVGRQVSAMVRGDLLEMARRHSHVFWPHDFADLRPFLRIIAQEPSSPVDIDVIADFCQTQILDAALDLTRSVRARRTRVVGALALVTFVASTYVAAENYDSEVTALVLGLCYVLAAVEKAGDDWRLFNEFISLITDRIYHSIELLVEEAIEKGALTEGDIITDKLVVHLRATRLCGLASVIVLRSLDSQKDSGKAATFLEFVWKHLTHTFLWGEGAIPSYVSTFFAIRRSSATVVPDLFLFGLIDAICARNRPRRREEDTSVVLASPYYDGTYAVLRAHNLDEIPFRPDFSGSSYSLDSLVRMAARRLWKQKLRLRWEAITHVSFVRFKPRDPWMYYLWRCKEGDNLVYYADMPTDWAELLHKSRARQEDDEVPDYLRSNPLFLMLFLIVYPHRFNPATVAILDASFSR